jgi:PAS domain S-box-containing protein
MTPLARVLIVEDEVIVALELQSHLERLGYAVLDTVTTGEEALEQAAALRPDLILMDIRLAGRLDGIEAARRIRTTQEVAVVFLTAYGDAATLERAKEASPFGYLLKPFNERELFATLEVALHKYRAQRRLQESHDDLVQLLDGLHLGTVLTDERGHITFMSQAARQLLGLEDSVVRDIPWPQAFPFNSSVLDRLKAMAHHDPAEATRLPARVERRDGRQYWAEIEVRDDPRHPERRIFVFYDATEVFNLRQQLTARQAYHDLIGTSKPMQAVFQQIEAVARVDSTVLIEGETGTGKELVARAIHNASHRKHKPFVAVNCAALTETLAASQLFGHRRGAFTGAVTDHEGYFGAAHGGTLFLDEIGDIPLDVQVNLLRVLEQRTITRVGETTPRPVDVRIVAASHRSLPEEVEKGRFRADLLYRIRVARVELPSLHERTGDIPLLVETFLTQCSTRMRKPMTDVSTEAMRALLDYAWPGNVRELRNVMEYAVIRAQGPILQREDLPPELKHPQLPGNIRAGTFSEATEKGRILAALQHTKGNRKEAARVLGISRATFYRWLTQHGLDTP